MREVVWLSSGDLPAPLQAPLVQALRKRPAEALRKAALYAGLQPDAEIKLSPLDAALAQHAADELLHGDLAARSSSGPRARRVWTAVPFPPACSAQVALTSLAASAVI